MIKDLPQLIDINFIEQFTGKKITVLDTLNFNLFNIKRSYWINYKNINDNISQHAHLKTKQILIAISGELNITLENLDGTSFNYLLNNASKALYIPNLYWKTINYNKDCILLSFASESYIEKDYIRNHKDFLALK